MRNVSVFGAFTLITGSDVQHLAFFIAQMIYIKKPDVTKLNEQSVETAWRTVNNLRIMHIIVAVCIFIGRIFEIYSVENANKQKEIEEKKENPEKFAPESYFDQKQKWALIVIDIIKIGASFYYFFAMLFMC